MNTKTLIYVDRWFWPIQYFLHGIHALIPASRQTPKRKLCVKFFGIGSIVRIAQVIKESDLDPADFVFLTLEKNDELLQILGFKTVVIRRSSSLKLGIDLIKTMFTVWQSEDMEIVDFERSSNISSAWSAMLGMGKKVTLFKHHKELNQAQKRIINLSEKSSIESIREAFDIKEDTQKQITKRDSSNLVVVNVNAGDYIGERKYPIESFIEVVILLANRFPQWEFVFSGSSKELNYVSGVQTKLDQSPVNYKIVAGTLSMSQFIDVIKQARLVITNDSSPLHLAYYFQTPVVGIWGPTSDKLVGYSNSNRMLNIGLNMSCAPCFVHPKSKVALECEGEIHCLNKLRAEQVADEIEQFTVNKKEKQVSYELQ